MLPEAFLITLNGLFTLAILSFLFRDNPIYKFAEHLFIGVAAGYYVGLEWHNVFIPNLWRPMIGAGDAGPGRNRFRRRHRSRFWPTRAY